MHWASAPLERRRWHSLLPYLAITACSLLIAPSVFTGEQMLCTAVDAPHFFYRLHEIDWLIDRGVLWPRWGPNLSYGYGYPVFHYYGSLAFYPSLVLHKLGFSLLTSFQAGFWLALMCSGWAAFAWLRQVTADERAAILGAIVYLYIPYHLNAILYRWNLPEPWSMVFPPLALYGLHRMACSPCRWSVALTALALAALPLTSNLAAVVFAPLLVTYALLLLLTTSNRSRLLVHVASTGALAFALCAFFVIPAFIDRDAVQIARGVATGGTNLYNHFLPLRRILTQPLFADASRANPLYDPLSLGFTGAAAVGFAAAAWFLRTHTARPLILWALVLTAVLVLLVTDIGEPVYRALPFLQILQFPWRFLAPASLAIALLVGLGCHAALRALSDQLATALTPALAVCWIVLSSPLFYPGTLCSQTANPTLKQAVAAQVGMVGTISTNAEYLPTTVSTIPKTSSMYDDYMAERPAIRWDQSSLPEGAQTLAVEDNGLSASWQVQSPTSFTAVYQAFMFPGWQASVDGQPNPIRVVPPHGLMGIDLPSGTHTVAVHFGSTPARTATAIVSAVALAVTVGLVVTAHGTDNSALYRALPWPSGLALVSAGALLLLVRTQVVDRWRIWPLVTRFDGETVAGIANPARIHWSGGERLIGYDLLTQPTSLGSPLELDLYWATRTGQPFRALIRLVDPEGKPWTEWDTITDFPGLIGPPGPGIWGPDRYTSLRYRIDIPVGTPSGRYSLTLRVIDPDTRAPHYVTEGTVLTAERIEAIAGPVDILPDTPSAVKRSQSANSPTSDLAPELVECTITRDHAQVGETVILWPLWRLSPSVTINDLEIALIDDSQHERLTHSALSQASKISQRTRLLRDRLEILIPARLSPGHYSWVIRANGIQHSVGSVVVLVPERQFDVPADIEPTQETLGGFAQLVGYRCSALDPGSPVTVDLFWRAEQETTTSYKSFVHVLDDRGQVVAQSDAIPAAWTRWTTGWLPPEVIQDTHVLYLPSNLSIGCCQAIAGLYDPVTGHRLLSGTGQDAVVLFEIRNDP